MKPRLALNRNAGLRPGAFADSHRAGSETGVPLFASSDHSEVWKLRRLTLLVGLVSLICLSAGCANVKPWDRDALAHYSMRPDRDPVTLSLREHMWFSREASNGGRSVGGGGCGCN